MTWLHLSVVGNIILGIVVVLFAIDRKYFHQTCTLRHNPIDAAIIRIEATLDALHTMFVEHLRNHKGE